MKVRVELGHSTVYLSAFKERKNNLVCNLDQVLKVLESEPRKENYLLTRNSAELLAGSMTSSAQEKTPHLPLEDTVRLGPGAPGGKGQVNTARKK